MSTTVPAVNTAAAQRILLDDEAARKAGFSPATPLFAVGTRLIEVGKSNFTKSRVEYDNLPSAEEALSGLIATIAQERRHSVDLPASRLEMTPEGTLHLRSPLVPEPLQLTPSSFRQLINRLSVKRNVPSPVSFLSAIEPDRRARIVNEELHRLKDSDAKFRFRIRTPNGHDEVFAVVSPRYTPADADVVANEIRKGAPALTKASILYRGTSTQISLLYHSDLPVDEVGVGEFYKAAQTFRANDDGTGPVTSSVELFRAICINLTTVESAQSLLSRRHVGKLENIIEALGKSIGVGQHKLKFFLEAWNVAAKQDVRELVHLNTGEVVTDDTPQRLFAHLFETERFKVQGVAIEKVVQACEDAWKVEAPDWSIVGLSNALTRAAHESPWSTSGDFEQSLQDTAGYLITGKPRWAVGAGV